MKCKEIHNSILPFLEKDLSHEKELLFQEHLNSCSDCLAKFQFIEAELAQIDSDKKTEADPFFITRVEQRLQNRQNEGFAIPRFSLIHKLQSSLVYVSIVIAIFSGIVIGTYSYQEYNTVTSLETEIVASEMMISYTSDNYTFE